MELQGHVNSAELCAPLKDVKISCLDFNNNVVHEVFSDNKGEWKLKYIENVTKVIFSHNEFVTKTYPGQTHLPETVRLLENKLIGYQDKLWFLPGEKISLYVHSLVKYKAKLYRHGLNKEFILDLGVHNAQIQQVPDGFFVKTGVNWQTSIIYQLPKYISPGIYSLFLETETKTGTKTQQECFAVPMLVSTPDRLQGKNTKLLVLASTNTWQSYNLWGGRSRYRNFEDNTSQDFIEIASLRQKIKSDISKFLPKLVKIFLRDIFGKDNQNQWMFKKLSIRRPFTNCALEETTPFEPFTNHLAAGEWRLLAWLERENIPYDIVSMYELHNNPDLPQHYSAIIFSTHCEYWSKAMFEAVKKYHEKNGLWILNISGNTMYREVEFFDDGSTRCVSLSFAKSCADETKLLGVRFDMSDYSTCAPFKILKPNHWAFTEIPINKKYQVFGTSSLNQNTSKKYTKYDPGRPGVADGLIGMGASGWETDKLSKTAGDNFIVIAKGMNKKGGADMVISEPNGNRGGVFSASSLVFSASLLIDNIASELLKNIISRVLESAEY